MLEKHKPWTYSLQVSQCDYCYQGAGDGDGREREEGRQCRVVVRLGVVDAIHPQRTKCNKVRCSHGLHISVTFCNLCTSP